jgi:glycosyltransferase involved in cell wall biosynthesis
VEGLQAAIKILVEDAPARQKLAAAARADFEERFTLERAVDQWRAVYQEVLSF